MNLLIANVAATSFMAGVGWLVQAVAYPLFASVGDERFREYHSGWSNRITPVVFPPMAIDLVTSSVLIFSHPQGIPAALPVAGFCLSAATWLSTALLQVPAHGRLSIGFDAAAHRRLVRTSWVRTVAWTVHAGIACWMLAAAS